MPRGIPNKPNTDGRTLNQAPSPDEWNARSDIMNNYNNEAKNKPPIESSVPIGELAYQTEGLQPRSRTAFTRTADDRVNHFIDKYARQTTETFRGKTYMPPECIPAGRNFLWGRKTVQGRPDDNNIGNLQAKHGWQFAQADEYPNYAFYSDDGGINDSSSLLYMGGLVGLDRDSRIHQAQLHQMSNVRNATEQHYSELKSANPNVQPRSVNNMEAYNDQFFASSEASRANTINF